MARRPAVNGPMVLGALVGLVLLVVATRWVLITAAVLAIPFGIWWLVDRRRPRAAATVPAAPPVVVPPPPAPPPAVPVRPAHPRPRPSSGTGTFAPPATALLAPTAARQRVRTLPGEVGVTVTREEDHQDVLATRHRAGASAPTRVVAELASCLIGKGRHRGRYGIEVRLAGQRVGELTAAMSERYADLVRGAEARGDVPRAEGLVGHGARGFQIELRLPRRS